MLVYSKNSSAKFHPYLIWNDGDLGFLAHDSMLSSLYALANPSVCLSVCSSHGWISPKRLKLGSCNFHHSVAPPLYFLQDKFHPEILMGSARAGPSNNGGLRSCRKQSIFVVLTLSLGGYQVRNSNLCRSYFKRIRQVGALSRANRGVSCAFLFLYISNSAVYGEWRCVS